jgi:hypothetical protein
MISSALEDTPAHVDGAEIIFNQPYHMFNIGPIQLK